MIKLKFTSIFLVFTTVTFAALYFTIILGMRPREKSWLKIFLYSQILLFIIHLINIYIGGTANYFYTIEPPIANNPLIIGTYPTHIIMMDFFALIHFYIMVICHMFLIMLSNNHGQRREVIFLILH